MNKKFPKKLVGLILFGFLSILLFVFLFKNISARIKSYNNLKSFCNIEEVGDIESWECAVFLSDYYINDFNKKCVKIILPTVDINTRNEIFCESSKVVNWDNPYEDYSLSIPVLMEISFKKHFFGKVINKIEFSLLDSNATYEILLSVNPYTSKPITFRTPEMEDIQDNGYYITRKTDWNTGEISDVLGLLNAQFNSFVIQDKEIVYNISFYIDNVYKEERVIAKTYEIFLNSLSDGYGEIVDFSDNPKELFDLNENYQIQLSFDQVGELDEAFIYEYIYNDNESYNLILQRVVIED